MLGVDTSMVILHAPLPGRRHDARVNTACLSLTVCQGDDSSMRILVSEDPSPSKSSSMTDWAGSDYSSLSLLAFLLCPCPSDPLIVRSHHLCQTTCTLPPPSVETVATVEPGY